jgi:hypothetical protein
MRAIEDYFKHECFWDATNPERDERIVNYFSCYHEEDTTIPRRWDRFQKCAKCGESIVVHDINLSTPNGYFWLLDALKEKDNMQRYIIHYAIQHGISCAMMQPDEFADLVDNYLQIRGEYKEKPVVD